MPYSVVCVHRVYRYNALSGMVVLHCTMYDVTMYNTLNFGKKFQNVLALP